VSRTKELRSVEQEQLAYKGLRVAVIAEQLGCSVAHVHELIAAKKLPAINIGVGKRPEYRVSQADFDRFIESAAA
jgi:excisionase family DNA binding protein